MDEPDAAFTTHVHREMVQRGYITGRRPGLAVLRIDPVLTIEAADVEGFLDTFAAVLTDV